MPSIALRDGGHSFIIKIMYFVYIIKSLKDGSYYTGITNNLKKRLSEHNSIGTKYSSTKQPFKLIWYCMFYDKSQAFEFEKYLKSGSGFAFRNKHLI